VGGAPYEREPSTPCLAYHDGSSSLGPKGPQHLPLHKEVWEEDDRGDLGDGGDHKGPLWKEIRNSDSLSCLVSCLVAVSRPPWMTPRSAPFLW
jgi:hypothetical protein